MAIDAFTLMASWEHVNRSLSAETKARLQEYLKKIEDRELQLEQKKISF